MHLTLIGAAGMLGSDLQATCQQQNRTLTTLDLPEIDITDPESIRNAVPATTDWIINCAAYTNVDGAETNQAAAFAVNATGPANLAAYCKESGIRLLQLSTDYVFDGASAIPYNEAAATNPLSVYGQSKLKGELAVQDSGCRYLIARTQSLFGWHGPNFIKAILRLVEQGNIPLQVVDDQISCPTWSVHLSEALLALIDADASGVVHTSSEGQCSWFDFACAITAATTPETEVLPVPAATYPRPAKRPPNSVLSKTKYTALTKQKFPPWQDALAGYLSNPPQ